jgi:trans-aconitate methyltransferase
MLRYARETFPARKFSNLEFVLMDARQIHFAEPFDIIFSNATLHWVDDHPAFLHGAAVCLKPGGRLVISCGGKGNAQDVFNAVRATLRTDRWRGFFRNLAAPYFFHRPEDYERWLPRFGFKPTLVRLANKEVQFTGSDGLAAWIRTTWLPYTQRVPPRQRDELIADVVQRFVAKHPADIMGKLTVRMVRLEIDALKNSATVSAE